MTRYAALLESAGQSPQGVRAAVVFTTQSIEVESQAIAADIATHDFSWSTPPTCVDAPLYRICDGAFRAADYRGAEGYVADGTPQLEYELPVRAWLPLGQPGPGPRAGVRASVVLPRCWVFNYSGSLPEVHIALGACTLHSAVCVTFLC